MLSHKGSLLPSTSNRCWPTPAPRLRVQCSRPRPVAARAVQTLEDVESASSHLLGKLEFHVEHWRNVASREQFFTTLEAMGCPKKLLALWDDFYNNYLSAMRASGVNHPEEVAAKVQATIADCALKEFVDPYTFPSFHQALVEPYNYFEFGQRYVGSLTDFDRSVLGYPDRWADVARQLADGHNVVLLANHQTEADPGVFAHMLMSTQPQLAKQVVYVAGDRVVTDPLCKPFSMGRNLFCVHSKKHLDDVPELKAAKMETNRKTLVAMTRALNQGGCLMWIAPSGGRDRPKADGTWSPDKFDATAVELMRNLVARAKQPGHLYPMAMYSWPMMPPPKTIEASIGERRITNYTPVGISICHELDVPAVVNGATEKEEQQARLAQAAWEATCAEYTALEQAINSQEFRAAHPQYAQPWRHGA